MSETKWTPGPWRANLHHTQESAGRTYGWINGGGQIVPLAGVTLGVEGCSQDEGRANARLIAAAPELYAELERVTGHLETWTRDHAHECTAEIDSAIHCARAALDKAST
jgi:hypothetical protein